MDIGLDYICKGEMIKIDTVRVLLDHDSEETLPPDDKFSWCRHMVINSGLAMPPMIAIKAKSFKTCCGKSSYTIATLVEACRGNIINDNFQITIDGVPVKNPESKDEQSSVLFMTQNGKFTGGGMVIHPYACMNDGMADITWISDP